ncbi:AraC family transcriptional regulator [Ralstonia solanacearum]|uniref:AraC family transcriptional regulator n=1 Tax=Ralstonia solanacearum TaxID=305 RepID=UPI0005C70199|nr:AraC family transcriptional regulator [Ralstonia solanacearum]MBB6592290.1 helix-turn-helix transcriptional regulator [Ralstonia solanacearum]MBB6596515.1 helix-turn-helix transcriptional regulator [Ralstonia solanacearum]MDB0542648.1 AraC family transcriptional regulator [Ralstonia solanacearum]MDB0552817.1 AraC family transcriptional regulator [Ralstonia solanacearum]MDB0557654.1 AraC family transcriptional regulator [Ralstonia solanacearum]
MLDFRTYGLAAPPHAHDFMQVVMPSRGVLAMEVDGRAGCVDVHHAALIPAGAAHAFEAAGSNAFIVLDIATPVLETPDLCALADRVFFALTPGLRALAAWLHSAHASHAGPVLDPALAQAWSSLALATLAAHPANRSAQYRVRLDPRAERAWRMIDQHYAQPLTVDALAAEVGLSTRRLAALFRAAYGTTLHARLAEVRLGHALSLLERSTLPIAEIAARTGYYDQSALTRHLRAARGITPAAVRRGG